MTIEQLNVKGCTFQSESILNRTHANLQRKPTLEFKNKEILLLTSDTLFHRAVISCSDITQSEKHFQTVALGSNLTQDGGGTIGSGKAYQWERCLKTAQGPERTSKIMAPLRNTVSLIHSNKCDPYKKKIYTEK